MSEVQIKRGGISLRNFDRYVVYSHLLSLGTSITKGSIKPMLYLTFALTIPGSGGSITKINNLIPIKIKVCHPCQNSTFRVIPM